MAASLASTSAKSRRPHSLPLQYFPRAIDAARCLPIKQFAFDGELIFPTSYSIHCNSSIPPPLAFSYCRSNATSL
jgi:hypothetical protein